MGYGVAGAGGVGDQGFKEIVPQCEPGPVLTLKRVVKKPSSTLQQSCLLLSQQWCSLDLVVGLSCQVDGL